MIDELLTEKQKNQIVATIEQQCRRFQRIEQQNNSLYYTPYASMRHNHSVTAAILSGFAPGRIHVNGVTVSDLYYGLNDNLVQPELRCENGVFHIYSSGSDRRGKKITERCNEYNNDLTNTPLFFFVIVTVGDNGELKKVELMLPDKYGTIVEARTIYTPANAISITA